MGASIGYGATSQWNQTAATAGFTADANWTPEGVPGPQDTAAFTNAIPGNQTILWGYSTPTANALFDSPDTSYTRYLDMGSYTWTVTNQFELAPDSEASRLLQRVRDEAHRFAIEHHRGRRDRAMTGSVFDELRGIGPVRKRALLAHFGSPERFLAASREELEAVPGVPGKVAREIHDQLNRTG